MLRMTQVVIWFRRINLCRLRTAYSINKVSLNNKLIFPVIVNLNRGGDRNA